ncbi:MAG: Hemin uptake protein hemP [Planctomycetota bacterium]|jgi:hemin uptake protein HemP
MPVEPTPRVDAAELLGGSREVEIVHNGRVYRLRLTASGKLILTA